MGMGMEMGKYVLINRDQSGVSGPNLLGSYSP